MRDPEGGDGRPPPPKRRTPEAKTQTPGGGPRPRTEDTGVFYLISGAALKLSLKTDIPTGPLCPGPSPRYGDEF